MAQVFILAVMLLMVSQAAAHNIWINPGNFFPEVGETVDIGIAWGHTYTANRTDQDISRECSGISGWWLRMV